MNIRSIPADELTPEHIAAWDTLQRADAALDSPYFRPEFTLTVASVRNDVEVGVLEEGGRYVGFFPFQRNRKNMAMPVGGPMSDFQGVIVRQDVAWSPRELLRGCGLSAWHFDHLLASQEPFRPHHWSVAPSPYIDLSRGWDGYQAEQHVLHKNSFKNVVRKLRSAVRRAGSVHIDVQTDNQAVFQSLIQWKIGQYNRTGATNVLSFDWTVGLLRQILNAKGEAFSGMLSALYQGDALAAVLLSMRSHGVVHAWCSAYNPDLAQLSPGLMLWMELAKGCPQLGIRRIDLGKGPEEYKQHLMSGTIDLAEGSVDFRPLTGMIHRNWHRAYQWTRHSPLRRSLLGPGRVLRRMIQSRSFR